MGKIGSEKKTAESKVFRSLSDTFVIAVAESQEEGPHTPEWGLRTRGHHCLKLVMCKRHGGGAALRGPEKDSDRNRRAWPRKMGWGQGGGHHLKLQQWPREQGLFVPMGTTLPMRHPH